MTSQGRVVAFGRGSVRGSNEGEQRGLGFRQSKETGLGLSLEHKGHSR